MTIDPAGHPSARPGGQGRDDTTAHDATTQGASRVQDAAAQEAQSLKERATEEARTRAEGAKQTVADEVSAVGDALRTAAGELRDGSPQAQMFGRMAEGLAEFADSVRGRSVPTLVDDLGAFARRNPGAFLGGAALLGFAAVRAARASRSDHHDAPGGQDAAGGPTAHAVVSHPVSAQGPATTPPPSAPGAGMPRNEDY